MEPEKFLISPLDRPRPQRVSDHDAPPQDQWFDDLADAEGFMMQAAWDDGIWACHYYKDGKYCETLSVAYGDDMWSK